MDVLESLCAVGDDCAVVERPDCEHCAKHSGKSCGDYLSCGEWREWFSYEWNNIKKAAERRRKNADKR